MRNLLWRFLFNDVAILSDCRETWRLCYHALLLNLKVHFEKKRHYNIPSNGTELNVITDLLRLFTCAFSSLVEEERKTKAIYLLATFFTFFCVFKLYKHRRINYAFCDKKNCLIALLVIFLSCSIPFIVVLDN